MQATKLILSWDWTSAPWFTRANTILAIGWRDQFEALALRIDERQRRSSSSRLNKLMLNA
jgi:hypothetical protein